MIRPFTCVCAMLAGASGLYLYSEKHRTTLLDQQISGIVTDTQHIRERTAMLRAEWALLNQPDRLQGLAGRFLPQLQAMAPTQFVQLASLDKRLPAPGPETPPHPIATPQTAPALVGQKPAVVPGEAPAADGTAIAQAETRTAAAPPIRLAQARPVHTPLARPVAAHHELQLADNGDTAEPRGDAPVLRRVAAHVVIHEAALHRPATHVAAPVRVAYAEPHSHPAVVTAISSSYARPPMLGAVAWRPAHASWSGARVTGYAPQASMSALGSSLAAGRTALPAPVPLSDGN